MGKLLNKKITSFIGCSLFLVFVSAPLASLALTEAMTQAVTQAVTSDCSILPSAGEIHYRFAVDGGISAVFESTLTVFQTPAYGSTKIETTHQFVNPRILIDGREIPMSQNAANGIALALGYGGTSYATLKSKGFIFGPSQILDFQQGHFFMRDTSVDDVFIDMKGSVSFYHPICANSTY